MSRRGPLVLAFLAIPLASVAVSAAPLSGRWDGVFHGGRGDQAVALILKARGASAVAGTLYMDGDEMGAVEDGRVNGDSIAFRVIDFRVLGRLEDDHLALTLFVAHGRSHDLEVRYSGADTSGLALPSGGGVHAIVPARWDLVPDSVLAAHVVPSGGPSAPLPCLRRGTLLLVGGGPSQADLAAEFVRLAGGPSARVVVIPNATDDPADTSGRLRQPEMWARALGVSRVTVLDARSRARADEESFVQPLRQASAVWLPGGQADLIVATYLGTRTEHELLALLDRGGVIGGTSAGALVWGSECQLFRQRPGENTYSLADAEDLLLGDPRAVCFGALRNVVLVPHFTEFHMQAATARTVQARPWLLALGIDEATALEVHGDVGTVRGRGLVTVYDGREHAGHPFLELRDGARYDLRRRQVL